MLPIHKFNYRKSKLIFSAIIIFLLLISTQNIFAMNSDYVIEMTFGQYGNREGDFNYPVCVVLDQESNIYITDWENNRIQIFNSDGDFIRMIPDEKSDFQIDGPVGIALDDDNNIATYQDTNSDTGSYYEQDDDSTIAGVEDDENIGEIGEDELYELQNDAEGHARHNNEEVKQDNDAEGHARKNIYDQEDQEADENSKQHT